eukprot:164417-Amphidinium_carterae.1
MRCHQQRLWNMRTRCGRRNARSYLISLRWIASVGDHGGNPRIVSTADGSSDGSKLKESVT